jgi:hypothetical protein
MVRKTIRQMADELYDDPDVAAAVVQDAADHNTTERIEAGELRLPGPVDAKVWHFRKTNTTQDSVDAAAKQARINDLEARLAKLEGAH